MPNSSHHPPVALFRVIAFGVLFFSVTAAGLQVLGIINQMDHPEPTVSIASLFAAPLLTLLGAMSVSAILEGLARVISTPRPRADDTSLATGRLIAVIEELQTTLPGLIAQAIQPPAEPEDQDRQMPTLEVDPNLHAAGINTVGTSPGDAHSAHLSGTDLSIERHLERMVKLLEEMKEVSMLDETQRQTRRQQNITRRKNSRLEEAARHINRQDWPQADALLHLLESLHPGDPDVLACRNQLDDARIATQAGEWDLLQNTVQDQVAMSRYAPAMQAIMQFLERYPTHTDGQHLAVRIKQEQQIYTENHSLRLYDEIKAAVENRQWRTALQGIQTFLDRFPEHSRANKIRQQVAVIQKNAEIEERLEQEDRIRDLINTRQFSEAADLSEDLLQRFPDSPQAAYLMELLPKLRERAVVGEEDAVSF